MSTSDIVCVECQTCPRLLSLTKNSGTVVGCDCDGPKYSMDAVPYELSIHDLPEPWVVVEGRAASQLAHEVDLCVDADVYKCPSCGDEFGITEVRRSCESCGFIPERNRWAPEEPDDDGEVDEGQAVLPDGGEVECGYCGTTDLAYELKSDRGPVSRCIECLAIEQLQQQFKLPFDVWLDRDEVEPPDQDEFPDAPDFEPFDPRKHGYLTARAWATVLARLKEDDPIVKRDPDAIGTIFEDTRTFLVNVMGSDAHRAPSELVDGGEGSR